MNKKISLLLSIVMVLGIIIPAYAADVDILTPAQDFSDVSSSHWAYDYIMDMKAKNIISGYPDGTFKPENSVLRSEFAKMLAGMTNTDAKDAEESSFDDVLATDWFFPYVEATKDWFGGKQGESGKALFLPNDSAIRVDIAVALVKAKGYDLTSKIDSSLLKDKFKDYESIPEDARLYVAIAVFNNLITGYEDGTFGPMKTVTRAETAAMLSRAFSGSSGTQTPAPSEEPTVTPAPTQTAAPTASPKPENKGSLALVNTIAKTKDANGNEQYILYLIQNNQEVTYTASATKVTFYSLSGQSQRAETEIDKVLSPGDAVKFSLDGKNEINNIQKMFDFATSTIASTSVSDSDDYSYVFAKVYKSGASMEIGASENRSYRVNKVADADVTYAEFDSTLTRATRGSVISSAGIKTYSAGKYYYVLIRMYNRRAQDIIQYRYQDPVDESKMNLAAFSS